MINEDDWCEALRKQKEKKLEMLREENKRYQEEKERIKRKELFY